MPHSRERTWRRERTWPDLERAISGRDGWRRVGREWHGPCPVSHMGSDTCWVHPGAGAVEVLGGCRACGGVGGRLDGPAWRQHLDALDGGQTPRQIREAAPRRRTTRAGVLGPRPGRVWAATRPPAGTPGAVYLAERVGWPPEVRLPASVGWLPASAARDLWPRLPGTATGALAYRFAAPGETDTSAVYVEAVAADGGRQPFPHAGKRPSVSGSDFSHGRRVFTATGSPEHGVVLCESVLDALAIVALARRGGGVAVDPAAAVFAAAGTSGLTPAAIPLCADGHVIIAAQDDRPGRHAARALRLAMRAAGRPDPRILIAPGADWAAHAAALYQTITGRHTPR